MDPEVLRNGLIYFILLAASLCLRAYAQAWVANRLGDRTPAMEGRLTTNPLPHIDILGTVALPLIFIFYLQPALNRTDLRLFLGWAKPVPINPHNFKNPKGGAVLVLSRETVELIGLCDRIYVIHDNTLAAEMSAAEATEHRILDAALSA